MIEVATRISRLAVKELEHDAFEHVFVHLPVGHNQPGFGYEFAKPARRPLDGFDPVVHIEHLSLSRQFPAIASRIRLGIESDDLGANGQAARRRRVDNRQVPDPGKGHLQRARDGSRRERQHVHLRAQLFQAFLMANAEPLLFVDNDQSEVLKRTFCEGAGVCR